MNRPGTKFQNTHAASQNPDKKEEDFQYKCLWTGCKVFGRASSSKSWLEKHVAGHVDGGQKPFQVISNVSGQARSC